MRISDWSSDVCSSDLLFDDRLERADHARGDERGQQVESEPRPALAGARSSRREQVLVVLRQAALAKVLALRPLVDLVDDGIDGDAADQLTLPVQHRLHDQTVFHYSIHHNTAKHVGKKKKAE